MACSRHFTSSVGQRTRVAKAEAKEPAAAFCRSLQERNCWSYLGTDLECSGAIAPAISSLNLYSKYQDKLTQSLGKNLQGKDQLLELDKKPSSFHPHTQLKYTWRLAPTFALFVILQWLLHNKHYQIFAFLDFNKHFHRLVLLDNFLVLKKSRNNNHLI